MAEKIIWSAIVVFLYKPFINFAVKTDIILKNKINTIIMKKLFLLSLSIVFALSVFARWDDVYYNQEKDPTEVRTHSLLGVSTYKTNRPTRACTKNRYAMLTTKIELP